MMMLEPSLTRSAASRFLPESSSVFFLPFSQIIHAEQVG
jgi:hypothetical protein